MDPARGRVHPEAPRGLWLLSLHGVGWPAEKPADHPWGCRDCNRPEVCVGGPGASGRWLGVGVGDLGSMKGNQAGGHELAWGHPRVTRGGGVGWEWVQGVCGARDGLCLQVPTPR